MMEINKYPNIDETIYSEKLSNGLEVIIIPKKYNKTYAAFATKFGSTINRFIPIGSSEYITVPLGVAHFLEHKLFEMEDGSDASNLLANLGADANAFTDYEQTAYITTSTSNTNEVISLLVDYVQSPFFNDENVEKEQGIIIQELKMYMDKPGSRIHLGILQNMFYQNPIREDIVGTEESIKSITKEVLYSCYNTFYHPSNMLLVVAGNVDPEEIINLVRDNQNKKNFPKPVDVVKEMLVEDNQVNKSSGSIKMDITMPKVCVGLKLPYRKYSKDELTLEEMKFKILLELAFGVSSTAYQDMLNKEIINTGFSYNVYLDDYCGYIKVQANTLKPELYSEYIINEFLNIKNFKIDPLNFEKIKKGLMGSFIKAFNNVEFIAHGIIDYKFRNSDLFTSIDFVKDLTIEDINELRKYFVKEAITDYIIYPKDKQ